MPGDDDDLLLLASGDPGGPPATAAALDVRAAARALILADAGLAGLVGGRVTPGHTPQGSAYPQLCYRQISRTRLGGLDGPAGLARSRLTFAAYAARQLDAMAIAAALRNLFDGLQTTVATAAGSLEITAAQVDDEGDDYCQAQDASDDGLYQINIDVFFNHRQSPAR